jgi:hypothetical protein
MFGFTVKALTPETLDDFAELDGTRACSPDAGVGTSIPTAWRAARAPRETGRSKQRLIADGIAHAALVYDGDRAVAHGLL